jgi:hypothetical protein
LNAKNLISESNFTVNFEIAPDSWLEDWLDFSSRDLLSHTASRLGGRGSLSSFLSTMHIGLKISAIILPLHSVN